MNDHDGIGEHKPTDLSPVGTHPLEAAGISQARIFLADLASPDAVNLEC